MSSANEKECFVIMAISVPKALLDMYRDGRATELVASVRDSLGFDIVIENPDD